jgi:hypothetical protein
MTPMASRETILYSLSAFVAWADNPFAVAIDGDTIPGWIVAANVDDRGQPTLAIYKWDAVSAWFERAEAWLSEIPPEEIDDYRSCTREEPIPGIIEALQETESQILDDEAKANP